MKTKPRASSSSPSKIATRKPGLGNPRLCHENEIVSMCMATSDLNAQHFEPQAADPDQYDSILQGIRTQVIEASKGFTKPLQQLLANKGRAIEMSRHNTCWNCCKPGHVRASCQEPRCHHSTDFNKG
jgi:hypothetical protein